MHKNWSANRCAFYIDCVWFKVLSCESGTYIRIWPAHLLEADPCPKHWQSDTVYWQYKSGFNQGWNDVIIQLTCITPRPCYATQIQVLSTFATEWCHSYWQHLVHTQDLRVPQGSVRWSKVHTASSVSRWRRPVSMRDENCPTYVVRTLAAFPNPCNVMKQVAMLQCKVLGNAMPLQHDFWATQHLGNTWPWQHNTLATQHLGNTWPWQHNTLATQPFGNSRPSQCNVRYVADAKIWLLFNGL